MRINDLAKASGVSVRTIRYYTQLGLIPEVEKKDNVKDYPESMIELLKNIKRLQTEQYIPLNKIKEILENDKLKDYLKDEENIEKETDNGLYQTISSEILTIYHVSKDITINVSGSKKLSQEKLNEIKMILER